MSREQLDLWAEHGKEITAISEAIEDLEQRGFLTWNLTRRPLVVLCGDRGIDLAKLDDERRALLEGTAGG